jgi:dihydrofolate reductase
MGSSLKFNFITDGIESAVEKARAAAGDKDVSVIGGANTAQQLIRARLLDEIEIGMVPVLFGEGLRLFEHLDGEMELEGTKVMDALGVTYLRFRVVK